MVFSGRDLQNVPVLGKAAWECKVRGASTVRVILLDRRSLVACATVRETAPSRHMGLSEV